VCEPVPAKKKKRGVRRLFAPGWWAGADRATAAPVRPASNCRSAGAGATGSNREAGGPPRPDLGAILARPPPSFPAAGHLARQLWPTPASRPRELALADRAKSLDRRSPRPAVWRKLPQVAGAAQRADAAIRAIAGFSAVALFDGNDAAGKAAHPPVTVRSTPGHYRIVPGSRRRPTRSRRIPYLLRFCGASRAAGFLTIFDRSWYGRVLSSARRRFLPPPPTGAAPMPRSTIFLAAASCVHAFFFFLRQRQSSGWPNSARTSSTGASRRAEPRCFQAAFKIHRRGLAPTGGRWTPTSGSVRGWIDRTSNRGPPPWTLVEANDSNFRAAVQGCLKTLCLRDRARPPSDVTVVTAIR